MGGGLPGRHREWLLHDLTTRTWWLRQLVRSIVQVLPVAVLVLILVPGELWVRVLAVVGGVSVGLIYAVAYLYEATEHRAMKAGYPRGMVQSVRDDGRADERLAAALRYADRHRDGQR